MHNESWKRNITRFVFEEDRGKKELVVSCFADLGCSGREGVCEHFGVDDVSGGARALPLLHPVTVEAPTIHLKIEQLNLVFHSFAQVGQTDRGTKTESCGRLPGLVDDSNEQIGFTNGHNLIAEAVLSVHQVGQNG